MGVGKGCGCCNNKIVTINLRFYPDKTSLHNVVGADGGNSQSNGSSADGVITAPSRNQFANPLFGNAAAAKLEDYDYAELPLRDGLK